MPTRPCFCDGPGCHLCNLYHQDERYRALWDGETVPPRKTTVNVTVIDGGTTVITQREESGSVTMRRPRRNGSPGTKLKAMLAAIGVVDPKGCNCEPHIQTMNAWGVEGCRANRDQIVKWLQEDSAKMANFDGDPAELDWGPMVDEAIRAAEKDAS